MRNKRPSAALYELLEKVSGTSGLDEALDVLDQSLRQLLAFDALAVFLPGEDRLTLAYMSGERRVPAGDAIAGQVAETHRPAFNRDPCPASGADGAYRSMIAVPLDDGADMAGVLALYSAEVRTFQPDDLGVLLWIREDLARAVKHAQQGAPADPAAFDALTGLPNEVGLFQRLDADLKRCRRQLRTLALLLCGVDGLSEVQARFGDHARQRTLQSIAAALRRTSRKDDCVARLGDEFALLLEEFPKSAFETKLSSMAAMVAGVGVAHFGERLLAVRAGDAYFPNDAGDAEGLITVATARQRDAAPIPDRTGEDLERLASALGQPLS
jgi:diguanylate cyclase (GGDEF)-like protein